MTSITSTTCRECGGSGRFRVGYFPNHEEFERTGPDEVCGVCGGSGTVTVTDVARHGVEALARALFEESQRVLAGHAAQDGEPFDVYEWDEWKSGLDGDEYRALARVALAFARARDAPHG